MRMTPVRVKTVKTQSQIVHLSFRKIQARREVNTGLLKGRGMGNKKYYHMKQRKYKIYMGTVDKLRTERS